MDNAIEIAINTYHELNASVVEELEETPSPLEFLRFVAKNRPFVVRNAATAWGASTNWDAAYLRDTMGKQEVNVAITPLGNADSVVEQENGRLVFVEPYEKCEPFCDFLDYIQDDTRLSQEGQGRRNVKYAQTQNDNLREEYCDLLHDVPEDISFAQIALEKQADAINMWIGNERSFTSLHKDHYENIYVQIRGQKHFVLLSPIEMPCINEQRLPWARYKRTGDVDQQDLGDLIIERVEDGELLPVATWDPDESELRATPYSHLSRPLRVTLQEGDMLYLPAMWYHTVRQSSGKEGFACSVNYWYDMDFSGGFWTANSFLHTVANVSASSGSYSKPEMNSSE